ncbi:MAG: phosphoglucomutase/phosphomannomutase family protein, partial [Candidatus Bipolaricaulia bacterium]
MEEVSFGTDGWRGVIADDYTYENLGRVAVATASYLKSPERRELEIYDEWGTPYRTSDDGVVVGYDGRFASENFALYVAKVLKEYGLPTCVSNTMVPTPALAFAVREMEAAAGIMITASHNPPEYNGFKVKIESGASAPPVVTDRIEANLPDDPPEVDSGSAVDRVDISSDYVDALGEIVDEDMITKNPVMAVIDYMYGSAQGLTAEVLEKFGVQSVEVRSDFNPSFRGIRPEPLEEYLDPLKEAVAE